MPASAALVHRFSGRRYKLDSAATTSKLYFLPLSFANLQKQGHAKQGIKNATETASIASRFALINGPMSLLPRFYPSGIGNKDQVFVPFLFEKCQPEEERKTHSLVHQERNFPIFGSPGTDRYGLYRHYGSSTSRGAGAHLKSLCRSCY